MREFAVGGAQTPAAAHERWPGLSGNRTSDACALGDARSSVAPCATVGDGAGHARAHGRGVTGDTGDAKRSPADTEAEAGRTAREPSRRGDRATAWAATSSEQARAEAVAALQRDVFAASSAAPRDSLARTWLALHSSWFGPRIEALPLTPPKLEGVMAALKAGGYRSAANYASRAKGLHILAGHPCSDELALSLRHSIVSTKRDIGPAKKSAPLPLEDVPR